MSNIKSLIEKAYTDYPEIFDKEALEAVDVSGIPEPALWKILLLPAMPKKKVGSIILTDDVQEAEKYNNSRSLVLATGPLAYCDPSRFKQHPDSTKNVAGCVAGDFVCHGKYAGQRLKIGDVEFMLLNDDEITGIIPNPAAMAAYL